MPESSVCAAPESTGFGTFASKETHLMVQQAGKAQTEEDREYAIHEREHGGNFKGSSGKREGNHPDCSDQREHEQDRQKKEAKENEKRLEIA